MDLLSSDMQLELVAAGMGLGLVPVRRGGESPYSPVAAPRGRQVQVVGPLVGDGSDAGLSAEAVPQATGERRDFSR